MSYTALVNFLSQEGTNRPLSLDHPVGSVIRHVESLERDLVRERERNERLKAALEIVAALADTGSPQHKERFDPYGVEETPAGWRVAEAMREVAVEALAKGGA